VLVAALTAAAAALLVVAGAAKLRTPAPAATMLAGLGVRPFARARVAARSAAAVEIGVGLAALTFGGRIAAAALAACYLALTAVAVRLATGPEPAPCGCFGAADGDVGLAHVVLDVVALGIAIAAIVVAPSGLAGWFGSDTGVALTAAGQAALLAAAGYLSITALPALSAARRALEN
jgi:hypothetical protein